MSASDPKRTFAVGPSRAACCALSYARDQPSVLVLNITRVGQRAF